MPDLRLSGIVKRFQDLVALDGLDLEVERGEFYCLFGPSAAGKTTTLRTIAGLTRPDSGSVHFGGADIAHAPVQGRDMAMVFQNFALYPHLSVYDNLAYPLRERGEDRAAIARQVGETAEMLRITHTLTRKPATLSGGEQQRVAIGRALVRRPALLLLDEPLTNLDAKLRHETRVELKRLHRELGMTLVFATPDQLEALSLGERIAVLEHGRVAQVGTPDDLYDRPLNRHIATSLGAPQMNLVPGTIARNRQESKELQIALPFISVAAQRWHERVQDNDSVLLGLRPQDLRPTREQTGSSFTAQVHLTEPLGDVTVVDLDANGTALRMLLPENEAYALRTGDPLQIDMDLDSAHLFYEESGVRID